jgi:ABC-type cobalamin/Fe3+-siderophores transport system ATPase subunit
LYRTTSTSSPSIAKRIVMMKDGSIVFKGSPEEVLTPEKIEDSL